MVRRILSILALTVLIFGPTDVLLSQSDSTQLPVYVNPNELRPLPEARHRELIEQLNYEGKPPPEKKPEQPRERRRDDGDISASQDADSFLNLGDLPRQVVYAILFLLVACLAFFIYRMIDFFDSRRQLPSEKTAARVDISEIQEERLNVRETETLLQRAERHEQYDLAIRLQFLALLKQLDEQSLIHYKKDKINREYILEMDATDYGDDFYSLTTDFERNWYGQYPLDRLSYRLIAEKFQAFRGRIARTKTDAAYA